MDRREFLRVLAAAGFTLPYSRLHADSFDQISGGIDAMFGEMEDSIDLQYQLIDNEIELAYQELEKEIARVWGNGDIKLPSKKQWVDYSDDRAVRREFDFDNGMLNVDAVVPPGQNISVILQHLNHAVNAAITDNEGNLAQKDAALHKAAAKLAAKGVRVDADAGQFSATPVLSGVLNKKQTDNTITLGPKRVINRQTQKEILQYKIPFSSGHYATLAKRYTEPVLANATQHDVPASLVLGVMQTESAFNPRARSNIPAYGLMQLVPGSGAMDAYRHIYGEKRLLGPDYLYTPEKNVELGVGYLNLVYNRYLSAIKDADSRWYCTVAAYNTGSGNVARAFGNKKISVAAKTINAMSSDQVFDHLQKHLPYDETKHYVVKVAKARKHYQEWDHV